MLRSSVTLTCPPLSLSSKHPRSLLTTSFSDRYNFTSRHMASQELPSFITASTFVTTVNGVPSTGVTTMVVSSDLPTQALPPYLSASSLTTVVGGVSTVVVSTVEVPITYFGPSVSGLHWHTTQLSSTVFFLPFFRFFTLENMRNVHTENCSHAHWRTL